MFNFYCRLLFYFSMTRHDVKYNHNDLFRNMFLLSYRNIDIGLYFLPRKEVAMPKFDITGAQMILDVAKIAQNLLNFAANFLEKLHSLLTWKDRRVTFVFYCLTIYWLTLSLIFSTGTCLGMCGITLGVRIFITTYLFHRFPRLRKRLDTYGWFYRNLPVKATAAILPVMKISTEALHPVSSKTVNLTGVFTSRLGSNFNLVNTGSQQTLNSCLSVPNFNPKHSSPDLTSYTNYKVRISKHSSTNPNVQFSDRSCVMNDKEKPFPKGISSGILYLTNNALIYRPKSTSDHGSITMLFADIVSLKKIQSFRTIGLIAGTRKSLEIHIRERKKPLQFIGIAQRDDFCSRIVSVCRDDTAIQFL
ncbi:unnamed protein product [Angiostrongylus costaricensis]|uniref:GRAM domain-containing protein n=1 Tax=Angiostrongylus costaricensis TaxID=334426 RepID=A0A0R3PGV0_ANGCS|nr:unnamed protein product [Angiostrongylus costaricensis]